jgi:hypothetical protein
MVLSARLWSNHNVHYSYCYDFKSYCSIHKEIGYENGKCI